MDKRSKIDVKKKSTQESTEVVLMIGGNLGNRLQNLDRAIKHIEKRIGKVTGASSVYETEAWGEDHDQPLFLNRAIIVNTALTPRQVLEEALSIEALMGRNRSAVKKGGARLIDIDILFFGNEIICENDLQIPHPKIQERNFVLIPLNEVIPAFIHPEINISINSLLANCNDVLKVKKVKI